MKSLWKSKQLHTVHKRCIAALFLFFTGIHILAWNSRTFTDWYRLHVFPAVSGVLARASGLFSGSVGEVFICIGVCLLAVQIVLLLVFAWDTVRSRKRKAGGKLRRVRRWNYRILAWIFIYIYGTETLNCFVMYHASTVEEQYYDAAAQYGTQELVSAYSQVVQKANALAGQVSRDARGQAVFDGTRQELYEACKKAMQAQGVHYPYLAGYYPDPKPIRASYFMSQQYLLGIYFPFTMEANYNTVMYPVNMPAAICHEFSHLKGVIREDEANYFGFAACIESEDIYLQYSGCLSVLSYLAGEVRKSVPSEIRAQLENADAQVCRDDIFLTKEQWEQTEKKAVLSTEAVNQATNVFLEKNLTMNGVADGMNSYSRVVRLVIDYYENQSP